MGHYLSEMEHGFDAAERRKHNLMVTTLFRPLTEGEKAELVTLLAPESPDLPTGEKP